MIIEMQSRCSSPDQLSSHDLREAMISDWKVANNNFHQK